MTYYQKNKSYLLEKGRRSRDIIKKESDYQKQKKKEFQKLSTINPTEEELHILKKAIYSYMAKMNKIRPLYSTITYEDIYGEGYISLCKAIYFYTKNRKRIKARRNVYLYNKIRFLLIDAYRKEFHTRRKRDWELISYNAVNENTDDEEFINILPAKKTKDKDIMMDFEYCFERIKKEFMNADQLRERWTNLDLFKALIMRVAYGVHYEDIGKKFNRQESCISILFSELLFPFFTEICDKIKEENPSSFY